VRRHRLLQHPHSGAFLWLKRLLGKSSRLSVHSVIIFKCMRCVRKKNRYPCGHRSGYRLDLTFVTS
jgi:hypothetical protein